MRERTKVAVVGAGFIGEIHLESYHRFVPEAEVTAICSRSGARAEALARRFNVPAWFTDVDDAARVRRLRRRRHLRAQLSPPAVTLAAAAPAKHVICEKPLARDARGGRRDDRGVPGARACKLMYAEELCFAPKYERVRQLVSEGALGGVYQMRQSEKHSGPHADWFYDVDRAGGGVLMDMGCHAFGWFRWMLGGQPKVESV